MNLNDFSSAKKIAICLLASIWLIISPAWAQTGADDPTKELLTKIRSIDQETKQIEANQKEILAQQEKILAQIDQLRIWTRRT